MRIDLYATEGHYFQHLAPIARALIALGVEVGGETMLDDGTPTVIAGMSDAGQVPTSRPLGLVDHGIGMTYRDCDHQSYNGGRNRERVSLFLYATHTARPPNEARYPDARHEVIGPARLDGYQQSIPTSAKRVVAFAWHYDLTIVPETRTAFPWYLGPLERLAQDSPWELVGHGHPRGTHWGHYDRLGIRVERDPMRVLAEADLVCFDNTSFGYEAAVLGIPVLALDAPWYRDQPRQPPRFYEYVPGLRLQSYPGQGNGPGETVQPYGRDNLNDAILLALADPAPARAERERVNTLMWDGLRDGHAADRGARAIVEWASCVT